MHSMGAGNIGALGIGLGVLLWLLLTALVGLFLHLMLVVPGRNDPSLCVRRFMCWLGCAGFFCGGLYGLLRSDWYLFVGPVVGLILGFVVGQIIGIIVWLRIRGG
jgi:hypothetical protein